MELPYHIHRAPKGKRSGEFFWGADMQTLLRSLQQAVMDARRLIDWLTIQPYVDDKRLGIIGVSLGGFIGNVLVGVDERISTCVSILAGGDPAMLVWKSWLTRSWQLLLIRQGITLKALRAQVRWLDPITYAKRVRHRNLLMVIADYDVFAPSETCWKLWHAWGRPPVIRLRTGHLCTLLSISALRRAVVQFAKLTLIDGLDAQSAFKKLPRVPSFAIKTEMLVIIGGKFGPGVAIELTDLDHARRTSLDLHAGLAGIYVGIQWEASRNLAIGLNIRLDGKRIIRPHISAFFIF
ncbi:MAG TPA: hypothetical protein EYP10_10215 [Armatimonadetes bacterium]|nr:hypothetical protein [Armatimonadota bacterium]